MKKYMSSMALVFIFYILSQIFVYAGDVPKIQANIEEAANRGNSGFATLSDDWVYYSNGNDEDRLFKMKKNGISVTRLYGLSARLLNVSGDWIYFKNRDSLISRIKNDGSTREFDLEIAAG